MTRPCPKWISAGLIAIALAAPGCSMFPVRRHPGIPDIYPVGSIERAHFSAMQRNGEASDYVLHLNDFVHETSELTPAGKDKVMDIAAKMRHAPFPILVERSEHNANPLLDAERRSMVAQSLYELGNPDADQRTIVSTPYAFGLRSVEAEYDYNRYILSRGQNGIGFNGQAGTNNIGGFGLNNVGGGNFGFGR